MKIIDIKPTEKTPKIILDDEELVFEMSGHSRPENVRDYYHVIETLKKFYTDTLQHPPYKDYLIKLKFKMGYFNSASAKLIADIFLSADEFVTKNCNIKAYWFFNEKDDDMLEAGEYFNEIVEKLPVQFVAIA